MVFQDAIIWKTSVFATGYRLPLILLKADFNGLEQKHIIW
jgi:hypothetical protein